MPDVGACSAPHPSQRHPGLGISTFPQGVKRGEVSEPCFLQIRAEEGSPKQCPDMTILPSHTVLITLESKGHGLSLIQFPSMSLKLTSSTPFNVWENGGSVIFCKNTPAWSLVCG